MTTDLRTTLALADPVRDDRYDDATLRRLARELMEPTGTTSRPDDEAGFVVTTGTGAARSRRRTVAALAVAAVLVGGVALVPTLVGRESRQHVEAAALLSRAADAITATDPPARGDQYWQLTTTGFALAQTGRSDGSVSAALVSQRSVSFVPVDGARPTVVVADPGRVVRQLSGGPGPAWTPGASGVSSLPAPTAATASWQTPTPDFLRGLPRDPDALTARLRADTAGQGRSADGEIVVTVADVLRTGLVPADLREALYRVLANVPGVVVTDASASVDGVAGVAFGYQESADGIRQELVVDVATGVLVGEREVATRGFDGVPAGTVIVQTATTRELVDRVPAEVEADGRVFHCVTDRERNVTCTG